MKLILKLQLFAGAVAACLLIAGGSYAAPVQWNAAVGNGHFYEVVLFDADGDGNADPLTWSQARSAAESTEFNGVMGNLASITSQLENEFVSGLFGAGDWIDIDGDGGRFAGPWIGGYQEGNADDSPWLWTTGEAYSYDSWGTGQPGNQSSDGEYQNYIHYFTTDTTPIGEMTWNDHYNDGRDIVHGYVVEWDETASVPVPAAVWLLGSGLLGMIGLRRRARK